MWDAVDGHEVVTAGGRGICIDHGINETFRADTAVRPYAEFVSNPVSVG